MGTGTSKIINLYAGTGIDLQFKGIAEPSTDPGQVINPEYWIADVQGTYVNFGGLVVGGQAFLVFDGNTWQKTEISTSNSVSFTNISANHTFPAVVHFGKVLSGIVFENGTNYIPQLSMGTTAGGTEIFGGETIDGMGSTVPQIRRIYSGSGSTTLYLHDGSEGDAWNGAVLKISFIFINV